MKTFKQFMMEEGPPITALTTRSGVKYHVHSDHAHKFKSFVDELEDSGYKIHSMSSYRPGATVAGSGRRSAHADAMAIDINPGKNPHTHPHQHNFGQTDMPEIVTKGRLHKKHGLGWGGEWKTSRDTMHFSAHPREGADPKWKPAEPSKLNSQPSEPVSQTPEPVPTAPPPVKRRGFTADHPGAGKEKSKPEPKLVELPKEVKPEVEPENVPAGGPDAAPEPEPKQKPEQPAKADSSSGTRWSDVRAKAGYSARQSVTSDPELLNLYNKWKESQIQEKFEHFVRKKYQ